MTDAIRYAAGGFQDRFRVTRTDGKAVRENARYLVFDYANDPHAKKAVEAYATSIANENPEMAADLRDCLVNPSAYPAQHD